MTEYSIKISVLSGNDSYYMSHKQGFLTETKFQNMACLTFIPDPSKTAKSPISCGSSWKNTASTVPSPIEYDAEKAAPIARIKILVKKYDLWLGIRK